MGLTSPLALCLMISLLPLPVAAAGTPAPLTFARGAAHLEVRGEEIRDSKMAVLPLSSTLTVIVSVEGSSTLEIVPIKSITTSKDWEVIPPSPFETVGLKNGRVRWQQTFRLSPMQAGQKDLSLAALRYRDAPDQAWQDITWDPVPVEVTTRIKDPDVSQARDITGIEERPEPQNWTRFLPWTAAVLVVLGVISGAIAWRQRRGPTSLPLPPGDWALVELTRLQKMPVPEGSPPGWFSTRVSAILRRYLDEEFRLQATRQTTAELLHSLESDPRFLRSTQDSLRAILERCDLGRFTGNELPPEECAALADAARSFVKQSIPRSPADSAGRMPEANSRSAPGNSL